MTGSWWASQAVQGIVWAYTNDRAEAVFPPSLQLAVIMHAGLFYHKCLSRAYQVQHGGCNMRAC